MTRSQVGPALTDNKAEKQKEQTQKREGRLKQVRKKVAHPESGLDQADNAEPGRCIQT